MARYVDIENHAEFIDALACLLEKCNFQHKQACLAPDCRDCLARLFTPFNSGHFLPAADVAPVVHGRWVFGEFNGIGTPVWCSECGEKTNNIADFRAWLDYPGHKYCGRCGAKMDGENHDP